MMKKTKPSAVIAVLAAATLCVWAVKAQTNTSSPAPKAGADSVVATGKGVEIKRSALDEAVVTIKSRVTAQGQSIPPEMQASLEWDVLHDLIFKSILSSKATAEDKAKGKENCDKFFAEIGKTYSDDALSAQIKSMGSTLEQFKKDKLEEMTCTAVLDRELKSKVNISDADVKKFYDENPEKFEQGEQVRAAHILISTMDKEQNPLPADKKKDKEKLAKEVKAKADKGEDFAKLAKEYSDDPGSKDKGGEYKFGRGEMVPAFEAAAFSMKTNQISDLVETQYGYHIIKVLEKFPAKKTELSEVSTQIKDYLTRREVMKRMPEYREQLEKDAAVKIIGVKEPPKEKTDLAPEKTDKAPAK